METRIANMTENSYSETYNYELPTEILIQIFMNLPARNLVLCRLVCTRWQDIIDCLKNKHSLWLNYCIKDYKHMFLQTRHRISAEMSYYNLYKAFSLWANLGQSVLVQDEFASASTKTNEIISFVLLPQDIIGVHTRNSIIYYNLISFHKIESKTIHGCYVRYDENDDAIVLLNANQLLFITRKHVADKDETNHVTFDNATIFLLHSGIVYFVKQDTQLFSCEYRASLTCTYINRCKEDIVSLGYKDGTLYFVTYVKNLYKVSGKNLVLLYALNDTNTLFETLDKYNLLTRLNWHMCSLWMFSMNQSIPEGPLRSLSVVFVYGDLVFIGTMWGILRIYYAPYTDGKLFFYDKEPIKQFNFMEPNTCPVLSYCPIKHIDVVEGIDEHTVLVAMPKKIAVLMFVHKFTGRP